MRPRTAGPVVAGCLLICLASPAAAQEHPISLKPTSPIDSIALAFDGASFVITGIVSAVGASTTRTVSPTHAIVVLVRSGADTAFVYPGGMRLPAGGKLTVIVDSMSEFTKGAAMLIFARGLAADRSGIAVKEIAHMPTAGMTRATVGDLVNKARSVRTQKEVTAMFDRATLVIAATVDSVRPVKPDSGTDRRRGEQNDYFRRAVVSVQRTFKGDPRGAPRTVDVFFRPMMGRADVLAPGHSYLLGLRPMASFRPAASIDAKNRFLLAEPGDIRVVADTSLLPTVRR